MKSHKISIYRRLFYLLAITVACILFLIAVARKNVGTNNPAGSKPVVDNNDSSGPTVILSYNDQSAVKNPTASFMYFVPLIAPTLVEMESSVDNGQQARLVSYTRKATLKSFYVSCEFEMLGKGFFKTTFNSPEVIATFREELEKGESVKNALDYIKFEGEGLGLIEVRGTITGSTETVTEVDIHFNARGRKSPVTIGLYSVAPVNGQYKYENKYNELIARVAKLSFKKHESEPRMGVKVISVNKAAKPSRFIGRVKGVIANFFINPPVVSKLGNDTMLDFGFALLKEKSSFTFPKATNIREPGTLAIN